MQDTFRIWCSVSMKPYKHYIPCGSMESWSSAVDAPDLALRLKGNPSVRTLVNVGLKSHGHTEPKQYSAKGPRGFSNVLCS